MPCLPKDKFHAKAYITHAKLDVVGAQALVGSSNFTRPGLTQNIELNIQVQSGREVAQLQEWYEEHWNQAQDVTPEILEVVDRHVREYTPFEVYAKALQEFFRGHEITAGEWDETQLADVPGARPLSAGGVLDADVHVVALPGQESNRNPALHLDAHGRDAPSAHHAEAAPEEPGRACPLRNRSGTARQRADIAVSERGGPKRVSRTEFCAPCRLP